jgi:hypothetical protein
MSRGRKERTPAQLALLDFHKYNVTPKTFRNTYRITKILVKRFFATLRVKKRSSDWLAKRFSETLVTSRSESSPKGHRKVRRRDAETQTVRATTRSSCFCPGSAPRASPRSERFTPRPRKRALVDVFAFSRRVRHSALSVERSIKLQNL